MGSSGKAPVFKRRVVTLGRPVPARRSVPFVPQAREQNALIINASHEIANEISLALSIKMPACSLLYAPTIQVARWILVRRKVTLVVSSPILPDGSVTSLVPLLESMEQSPDLVVVGKLSAESTERLGRSGYALSSLRHLEERLQTPRPKGGDVKISPFSGVSQRQPPPHKMEVTVQALGADIRDRLNNPLQEIVAMAFVARATDQISTTTVEALDAIQRAAQSMAGVVNSLEDRIRKAVVTPR